MYFIIQISEYMLLSHIMHFVNFWWVILLNNVILTWLMKTVDQNAWTIKIIGHYDCWTRNQRFWVKPRFFFPAFSDQLASVCINLLVSTSKTETWMQETKVLMSSLSLCFTSQAKNLEMSQVSLPLTTPNLPLRQLVESISRIEMCAVLLFLPHLLLSTQTPVWSSFVHTPSCFSVHCLMISSVLESNHVALSLGNLQGSVLSQRAVLPVIRKLSACCSCLDSGFPSCILPQWMFYILRSSLFFWLCA